MASGKSLELAKIKAPKPSPICICGLVWKAHMKRDGQLMKRYEDKDKHHPNTPVIPYNRRQFRSAMRKSSHTE